MLPGQAIMELAKNLIFSSQKNYPQINKYDIYHNKYISHTRELRRVALKLLSQALVLEPHARFEGRLVPIKQCAVFGR